MHLLTRSLKALDELGSMSSAAASDFLLGLVSEGLCDVRFYVDLLSCVAH